MVKLLTWDDPSLYLNANSVNFRLKPIFSYSQIHNSAKKHTKCVLDSSQVYFCFLQIMQNCCSTKCVSRGTERALYEMQMSFNLPANSDNHSHIFAWHCLCDCVWGPMPFTENYHFRKHFTICWSVARREIDRQYIKVCCILCVGKHSANSLRSCPWFRLIDSILIMFELRFPSPEAFARKPGIGCHH